jgi:hypothetical protein
LQLGLEDYPIPLSHPTIEQATLDNLGELPQQLLRYADKHQQGHLTFQEVENYELPFLLSHKYQLATSPYPLLSQLSSCLIICNIQNNPEHLPCGDKLGKNQILFDLTCKKSFAGDLCPTHCKHHSNNLSK